MAIRFWKTRWYLGCLLPIIFIVDVILFCRLGPGSLAVFGLVLDIQGALILAIPDIPTLRNRTVQGMLKSDRRNLDQDEFGFSAKIDPAFFEEGFGTESQREGFSEFKSALRRQYSQRNDVGDYDWERIHTISAEVVNGKRIWKAMTPDGSEFEWDYRYGKQFLRQEESEQEGRTRRLGIGLLLIGFMHQSVPYMI